MYSCNEAVRGDSIMIHYWVMEMQSSSDVNDLARIVILSGIVDHILQTTYNNMGMT